MKKPPEGGLGIAVKLKTYSAANLGAFLEALAAN
jgi:hypothetical protein